MEGMHGAQFRAGRYEFHAFCRHPTLTAPSCVLQPRSFCYDFKCTYMERECYSLSRVQHIATPWTVASQALLSMGFSQARILEWVAIFFSRESSQPRYRTQVSCISSRFFTSWATREALHIRWNALNLMLFPVFFPLSSVLGIYPYCLLTCTCLLFTATCSICMHPGHLI